MGFLGVLIGGIQTDVVDIGLGAVGLAYHGHGISSDEFVYLTGGVVDISENTCPPLTGVHT